MVVVSKMFAGSKLGRQSFGTCFCHTQVHRSSLRQGPRFRALDAVLLRTNKNNSTAVSEPSEELQKVLKSLNGLELPDGFSLEKSLQVTEAFWKAMKNGPKKAPKIVDCTTHAQTELESPPQYDVCVSGGTLGLFLACSLQQRSYKVCVVEKRRVEGRTQEWNISRDDFMTLVKMGLLNESELERSIVTSWCRDRISFHGGRQDMWVTGVLDLGVSPKVLIEILREKFLRDGGEILENSALRTVSTYKNGVQVEFSVSSASEDVTASDVNRAGYMGGVDSIPKSTKQSNCLTARLLIDCMGHYSPIVKQSREGQKEDGVVIVVGGCFEGIPEDQNSTADILVTREDSDNDLQFFWEAFPADGGTKRTVYMFAYSDAQPERPSFSTFLEIFLKRFQDYQHVRLEDVKFHRILMGGFPSYQKNVPLKPSFDRIIPIGDAASSQSPLSFGGFASLVKHLPRLTTAISQALDENRLSRQELAWIQMYLPSVSVAFLFQRSMSLRVGQQMSWIPADHINRLMLCNFAVMSFLGSRVLKPFVQDSIQFLPLALTMWGMMFKDPITITRVVFQVGIKSIIQWFGHFFALLLYSLLHFILCPLRGVLKGYRFQRFCEAIEYGSGFA